MVRRVLAVWFTLVLAVMLYVTVAASLGGLVLLLVLGNIAIAGYLLWALSRLDPRDGIDGLFRRAS